MPGRFPDEERSRGQWVTEFTRHQFLRRSAALGIPLSVAGAIVASCGGGGESVASGENEEPTDSGVSEPPAGSPEKAIVPVTLGDRWEATMPDGTEVIWVFEPSGTFRELAVGSDDIAEVLLLG